MKIGKMILAVLIALFLFSALASAQEASDESDSNKTLVIVGCLLAVTIAGISSAIGLTFSGTSAAAVVGEKPNLFGRILVLEILPMTQSVYGLLTAILLMMGAGLLGGSAKTITYLQGMGGLWIGLMVGITGISAINQGVVAASSISAVGRNPDVAARGIIFTVMPETIAIFGLLAGILLMTGLKFLGG